MDLSLLQPIWSRPTSHTKRIFIYKEKALLLQRNINGHMTIVFILFQATGGQKNFRIRNQSPASKIDTGSIMIKSFSLCKLIHISGIHFLHNSFSDRCWNMSAINDVAPVFNKSNPLFPDKRGFYALRCLSFRLIQVPISWQPGS